MGSDDHKGNNPRPRGGEEGKPARNARGHWLPGHCPNPKGRPRKKPKVVHDQSDIRIFGSTLVNVQSGGQKESMDRRTALLNKMFESAMKGRVSMQRFLYHEFERNAARLAAARVHYDRLILDWVIDNPDFGKRDFEMPIEVEADMLSLRALLNHYFPHEYPLDSMSENDDGD